MCRASVPLLLVLCQLQQHSPLLYTAMCLYFQGGRGNDARNSAGLPGRAADWLSHSRCLGDALVELRADCIQGVQGADREHLSNHSRFALLGRVAHDDAQHKEL